jgi:hypothetical protein
MSTILGECFWFKTNQCAYTDPSQCNRKHPQTGDALDCPRAKILDLKTRLETEVKTLKGEVRRLDKLIAETERAKPSFATDLRAQRGRLIDRLTHCGVTYDTCWPNSWFILKMLEGFYREMPIH